MAAHARRHDEPSCFARRRPRSKAALSLSDRTSGGLRGGWRRRILARLTSASSRRSRSAAPRSIYWGRERWGGGARGLCFAAHAGRARSRAQGHLRLQPRVQTAHVSPLCAARPRRIRQGIATAVPRRADRRRMDTLLRGRHRRRPGRPESLCHAPRGAVEGGARVRLRSRRCCRPCSPTTGECWSTAASSTIFRSLP